MKKIYLDSHLKSFTKKYKFQGNFKIKYNISIYKKSRRKNFLNLPSLEEVQFTKSKMKTLLYVTKFKF